MAKTTFTPVQEQIATAIVARLDRLDIVLRDKHEGVNLNPEAARSYIASTLADVAEFWDIGPAFEEEEN